MAGKSPFDEERDKYGKIRRTYRGNDPRLVGGQVRRGKKYAQEEAKKLRELRNLGRGNRATGKRKETSRINRSVDRNTGEVIYTPGFGNYGNKSNSVDFVDRGDGNYGFLSAEGDINQPDVRGDFVSLKVEVEFNAASWSDTVAEIKAFENFIHRIDEDDYRFYENTGVGNYGNLKHFKGVYRMMVAMARRSVASVPPLMPIWKEYVASMNAANFGLGGLPVGGWAPYDAEYAAIAGPKPDLVMTGMLSFSLTSGLLVEDVRGDRVEFGTRVEHAKFHQYGTTKMPARKIVFEPQGASKFFGELVGRWVARERVSLNYESVG